MKPIILNPPAGDDIPENARVDRADMRDIVCGLVPNMVAFLARSDADVVEIAIRQGIDDEILSGFGTTDTWRMTFHIQLDHTVCRFVRSGEKKKWGFQLDMLGF